MKAAIRMAASRATMAFACESSRRCLGGTEGKPRMCVRVRTRGGPPSLLVEPLPSKCRDIENVLHGGAAMMVRNSPRLARWSSRLCTSSFRMSPSEPPPVTGSLSSISTSKPYLVRKAASPSGRRYGPQNRSSTVRDRLATAVSPLVALSYASAADMAGGISASATGGDGFDSLSESTADEVGGGVGIELPMRWSPLGRHGMTPSSK